MNRALVPALFLTLALSACHADATDAPPVAVPANFNPMLTLAPLVDNVRPAVVNVYTTQRQAIPTMYQYAYGWPKEHVQEGQGSGFVITADGYILTNNHVVSGASEVKVKFDSGEEFPATVIGLDRGSDVALLKIESPRPLPWLKLAASDRAKVGDWVVAVGNPLGLGHTVTAGIISAKGREVPDLDALEEFIQTDASINPGNSGGPLIGLDGAVVGMNTAIVSGANSVGFAIPADHLALVVPQLRETGTVARGWLGVGTAALNARGLKQFNVDGGALVVRMSEGSPAALAGLAPGDVILNIGGKTITSDKDVYRAIASRNPGDEVLIRYLREGKPKESKVLLVVRPSG
jgi:serine protease Do